MSTTGIGTKLDDTGQDFLKYLQQNNPAGGEQDPQEPTTVFGSGISTQSPRERAGGGGPAQGVNPDQPYQPPSATPPSPEAFQGPQSTPPQSQAPNPVSANLAQPFTPLPAPQPESLVKPLGQGSLLGKAGGLMGGGLGVSDLGGGGPDQTDSLLPLLMQLMNK